ncbi:hypothetical protein M8C21_032534 [Ambrosia artemisiifolia]|uniref:Uncharacterized protein n=1 Tax=Ambrosia artemisiifolia TaxID=4212 RepID=A0AAD5GPC3_AMBAR|nr:hypothetical protein M8C21_032534 [Ambrosia artemisiifolia]
MRGVNDTINAAASAIQSAENRAVQDSSVQSKKISDSAIVPEPSFSRAEAQPATNTAQQPSIVLPFIAPPSSPASFLQSEPPSASHSPGGVLSFMAVSGGGYSPGGPRNMFAVGPYAHETQLVSPPVFSTYTTEPSTAPFTPPPESVHLTTPSSPEVPYARYLGSGKGNNVVGYEFQSYMLYPGSPMGQLKSPGSGISNSGTSSPFLHFPTSGKVSPCGWESGTGSGVLTPDPVGPKPRDGYLVTSMGPYRIMDQHQPHLVDHRVSFEVTPEQVVRCVERRRIADVANGRESHDDVAKGYECSSGERHQRHRSTNTLGSVKEFNFDSADGGESDWWTRENNVLGTENGPIKNWSFFPMIHPGVS